MKGESESVTEANAIRTHGNRIRKIYQFGAVLIAVAMISSALTLVAIGDGPSGFTTEIGPGAMVEDAEYLIFYDDGESSYYAKNGQTGALDYSGTGNTVLQSTIDATTTNGGKIQLKDGLTLDTLDLAMKDNVILEGLHIGVTITFDTKRINLASCDNVTIRGLTFDATDLGVRNAFAITGTGSDILFEDLVITGHTGAVDAIVSLVTSMTNLRFSNVRFLDYEATEDCIILYPGNHNVVVENCYVSGPVVPSKQKLVSTTGVDGLIIRDCEVARMGLFNGYDSSGVVEGLRITNNRVIEGYDEYAIVVMGGSGSTPIPSHDCVISNNIITASDANSDNAIAIYGLSHDVSVIGNICNMTLSGHNAIAVSSGEWVVISNNVVWGCTQETEGGIEVESNPVHNRLTGISKNIIISNNIVHNSTWGIYTRIMLPAHANWAGNPLPSEYIMIKDNLVTDCTIGINLIHGIDVEVSGNRLINNTTPLLNAGGTDVVGYVIYDNIGYVTENSGSQTITGAVNSVDVTHELDVTPTTVLVAGNNTGIGDYWVTTIGAATFTISFESQPGASSWAFYWYAEVR